MVYREAMRLALLEIGLRVDAQKPLPVYFRGHTIGSFRADLVVENTVILELKMADRIAKPHEGQLLHYLCSSTVEVGLILNFGDAATFRRMILTNDLKRSLQPAGIRISSAFV